MGSLNVAIRLQGSDCWLFFILCLEVSCLCHRGLEEGSSAFLSSVNNDERSSWEGGWCDGGSLW